MKLRETSLPEEITEVQKRIKFIVHRMENAIENHEFEKARFYSDEERKERDNLRPCERSTKSTMPSVAESAERIWKNSSGCGQGHR